MLVVVLRVFPPCCFLFVDTMIFFYYNIYFYLTDPSEVSKQEALEYKIWSLEAVVSL